MIKKIYELVEKSKNNNFDKNDARYILDNFTKNPPAFMFGASELKKLFLSDNINLEICSIINAKSGLCSEDCNFCAQSSHYKTKVNTYNLLSKEKILNDYKKSSKKSNHYGIVTSGKKPTAKEIDLLREIIKDSSNINEKKEICASLGNLNKDELRKLQSAGLKRFHHNLETSRNYFPKICTTHSYDEKIKTIKDAKSIGLEICSGALFGLGENENDRIDLDFELKNLNVNAIPLNFLNPVKGTPAYDKYFKNPIKPLSGLAVICMFRFVNPDKEIKIAGGREFTFRDLQSMIFYAGANGFMIGNYLTIKGRNIDDDIQMMKDLEIE